MHTTSIDTLNLPSKSLAPRGPVSLSLPQPVWRPFWSRLRSLAGHFSGRFIRPIFGFGFDLRGAIYKADGCRFKIPVHLTDRNYRSAFVFGEYEAGERKLIRRFLRPDDRVIELGGCIGVLSCLVNARLKTRAHHLVVEANPELIPLLRHHRELNQACFEIEQCAISTESEVTFSVHRLMTHSGIFAESTRRIQVRGRSLAELNESHGPFNVLMIDIEGSELEVLRNSSDLLMEYRLVIIELHPEQLGVEGLEECRSILTSVGLKRSAVVKSVEAWVRPELYGHRESSRTAIGFSAEQGSPQATKSPAKWSRTVRYQHSYQMTSLSALTQQSNEYPAD